MPYITTAERLGREEGLKKGEVIGEIRATQRFLKQPRTPMPQLAGKSPKSLKAMLKELEAELEQVT